MISPLPAAPSIAIKCYDCNIRSTMVRPSKTDKDKNLQSSTSKWPTLAYLLISGGCVWAALGSKPSCRYKYGAVRT